MSETANLIALWMSVGFAHGKVPDGIGFRGGTLYSNILKNGFYLSPWSSVLLLSSPTALSVVQGAFVTVTLSDLSKHICDRTSIWGQEFSELLQQCSAQRQHTDAIYKFDCSEFDP